VTRTSFIAVVIPLLALFLGAIVRHERPGALALVGALIILGAVLAGIAGERTAR